MKEPVNKKTLEERINESNKKHNFKYDYSLIKEYKSIKDEVPIICPKHGIFYRTFDSHIHKGRGCPMCSKRPNYNKELFIMKSNEIHGHKYDYSSVQDFDCGEMNKETKIKVICPKHGPFETTIYNHLQGYGCKKCGFESMASKRIRPFEEFKKIATEVHGERYQYDESTYTGMKKDMRIICPIHGEFWQKPIKHIYGHGCQKCKNSKLEEQMMIHLDKNNIEYVIQYAPEFLKNGKGQQKLDFYLPKHNIAIECQGIQHFVPSKYHLFSEVDKTIKRDTLKAKKCEKENIKILYYTTDENIKFKDNVEIYNDENIFCSLNDVTDRLRKVL